MAPRESFKIDKNDPDLQTFELYIAELHPEFRELRQNRQPSYEHPDFCEKTLEFSCLPASDDPYDLLAINLFDKSDIEKYISYVFDRLREKISKLISNDKLKFRTFSRIEKELVNVKYNSVIDNAITNGIQESDNVLKYSYSILDPWLSEYLPTIINIDKNILINNELLNEIVIKTKEVVTVLKELSQAPFMRQDVEMSLWNKDKCFAFLSTLFLTEYVGGLEDYVNEYFQSYEDYKASKKINIIYDRGYLADSGMPRWIKLYAVLILCYELLNVLGDDSKVDKYQSPSKFIYIYRHGGSAGDDFNITYRWLFIKAWLYSYLKNKDMSASKASLAIVKDDRFYYLDNELRIVKDGYKETDEECFSRRKNTLTKELSKWNKHTGEFGYVSQMLFKKSMNSYEKQKKKGL